MYTVWHLHIRKKTTAMDLGKNTCTVDTFVVVAALLGCGPTSLGKWCPTFRNLVVSSLNVDMDTSTITLSRNVG
jgi:hypothetical protein